MNTMLWLLKREYWEHRGGFLWAPVWTAAVVLFFTFSTLIAGEILGARFGDQGFQIHIGGPLNELIANTSPEAMEKLGVVINTALAALAGLILMVTTFVLFFYLIGALYDDRRDRSVLFWKSLPISDAQTVISKVITAAFIVPAIAFVITLAMHLGFLLLVGIFLTFHGVNPTFLLSAPNLLTVWIKLLTMLPLNIVWALPCYGWLLLCSSFARSKPFLWAIVPPVLFGWLLSLFDIIGGSIPHTFYWKQVAGRILLGIVPGGWNWQGAWRIGGDSGIAFTDWSVFGHTLTSANLWVGAAAGLGMLAGAVYFRRFRTETSS